jgi:hypothetical protein
MLTIREYYFYDNIGVSGSGACHTNGTSEGYKQIKT